MPGEIDPDSILYCNCSHCGRLLVGESTARHVRAMSGEWPIGMSPPVHIRIGGKYGRPLCEACGRLAAKAKKGS